MTHQLSIPIAFVAGLVSFLSPCVLPLIPGYISMLSGVSMEELKAEGAAGLGALAIPVVGVVAAWLQLGERPSAVEAVGMALVVGALAVLAARGLAAGWRQPSPAEQEPAVQPVTD